MAIDPKDCTHEAFFTEVKIVRLEDSGKFMAEIQIRCVQCEEPFRFLGVQAGLRFDGPACSIEGLTLHAPIEPEIERRLHERASYHMPEIPRRH